LARSVRPDDRDALSALHGPLDPVVDAPLAEGLAQVLEDRHVPPRALRRREAELHGRAFLEELDALELLELFGAALGLGGLGRLGAETVDEALQLGLLLFHLPGL